MPAWSIKSGSESLVWEIIFLFVMVAIDEALRAEVNAFPPEAIVKSSGPTVLTA